MSLSKLVLAVVTVVLFTADPAAGTTSGGTQDTGDADSDIPSQVFPNTRAPGEGPPDGEASNDLTGHATSQEQATGVQQPSGHVHRIVTSTWFPLISGLASLLGVALALYQLRIRHAPRSRLRSLEWQKVFIAASGVGLLTFSGVSLYSQQRPPGFLPFRHVYDALHGTCGSSWLGTYYEFDAAAQQTDYTATIQVVAFYVGASRIYYQATCRDPNHCAPFSDAAIRVGGGPVLEPIDSFLMPSEHDPRVIDGYIGFPNFSQECGRLQVWTDRKASTNDKGELSSPTFRLHTDARPTGTSAWGWLALISLGILVSGVAYNPLSSLKRRVMMEGMEIRNKQDAELRKILGGRRYEDLSTADRHRYDEARRYYSRNLDLVFEMFAGAKPPPGDEDVHH